jgi:hypothetical protein
MTRPTAQPVWDRPADQVRDAFGRQADQIRANGDLNYQAIQRGIAKAWIRAKTQLDQLAAQSGTDKTADLADAKARAFGLPDILKGATAAEAASITMSFRDAQQRASQLESPGDIQELYDTAKQSGDELLVRAVANRAMAFNLDTVSGDYLASHPQQAQALQDLRELTRPLSAAAMFEFLAPTPSELAGLAPFQIEALADGAS